MRGGRAGAGGGAQLDSGRAAAERGAAARLAGVPVPGPSRRRGGDAHVPCGVPHRAGRGGLPDGPLRPPPWRPRRAGLPARCARPRRRLAGLGQLRQPGSAHICVAPYSWPGDDLQAAGFSSVIKFTRSAMYYTMGVHTQPLPARLHAIACIPVGVVIDGFEVLLHAGLEFVKAMWGCLFAGVVAVPVCPPDPTRLAQTLPGLVRIVADCGAKAMLTDWQYDKVGTSACAIRPHVASHAGAVPYITGGVRGCCLSGGLG